MRSDSGVGESIKSDNDDLPNYGVAGAHASATMYPPIDQPSSKLPIIDLETMSPQTVHGSMSPSMSPLMSPSHNYSSPDKPPKPETASNSPPAAPNSTSANVSKTGKISSAINLTPVMPSPGPTVRQRISNWMRSADKHPVDKREVVKLLKKKGFVLFCGLTIFENHFSIINLMVIFFINFNLRIFTFQKYLFF